MTPATDPEPGSSPEGDHLTVQHRAVRPGADPAPQDLAGTGVDDHRAERPLGVPPSLKAPAPS
ncbi:hypothetical protein OG889_01245 [Streptomyces sp. NBC_00481]|nr:MULTISPECIES: hypothetical protein [unclassified Streptomyces]WRY93463.1 hypothetical protein OG889_01245 [Streptomyces sp. NBC_00481]